MTRQMMKLRVNLGLGQNLFLYLLFCSLDRAALATEREAVRVVPGNTLSLISLASYGTSARWKEIADLNHIGPPYLLRINQLLRLPEPKTTSAAKTNLLLWQQARRKFNLPPEGPEYQQALEAYYSAENHTARTLASLEEHTLKIPNIEPVEAARNEIKVERVQVTQHSNPDEESKTAMLAEIAEQKVVAEKQAQDIKKWSDNGGEKLLKEKNFSKAFKEFPIKLETEAVRKSTATHSNVLWIEGATAEIIYKYMSKVPSIHSTLDFKLPPPKEISFEDMERKVGKNIACVFQPLVNTSSNEYIRGQDNQVILKSRCLGSKEK
jgi:hypothetical protein